MTNPQRQDNSFVFRISRTFDAPRERIWKAWTDPVLYMQWFGPKDGKIYACDIDLRAGGHLRYSMDCAGVKMHGLATYLELKEPEKIVSVFSFTDEHGNKTRHPFMATWPMDVHSVITFFEDGKKTAVTVQWTPHNATDIETKTFQGGMAGAQQGWGGTFDRLTAFLATD